MNKREVIIQDIARREESIFGYQINIDNFKIGIDLIHKQHSDVPHLVEFAKVLEKLLIDNQQEQDKESLMLQVAKIQLEEIDHVCKD